ncbi:hypothetical protein SAMN02927924_02611 [Sphingobium faniae]|nr:hypothetical protein SAMN02927924_02611 [Sphingobium faniae]
MGANADRLVAMLNEADPYLHTVEELAPLQQAAIAERFEEQHARIPALRQRCKEIGLEKVGSAADLVPILFSHTTYKSYPEMLVEKGQWRYMSKWLATLTAQPGAEDVDVSGATDVDDWIAAMHSAGHHLNATSGTTGKCSFLDQSAADFERRGLIPGIRWKTGQEPGADRPFYGLVSSQGFNQFTRSFHLMAQAYGRPGDIHFLTDEPGRVSDINRMARLRRAMVAGTASPGEIEALERDATARARHMAALFDRMAEDILSRRNEPIMLMGLAAQHWALANAMRDRGVTGDALHPDSIVGPSIRRNTKGNNFPPDYAEQIFGIYGIDGNKVLAGYAMSEISTRMMQCEAGHYHIPPWQPVVLVDRDATRAIDMPMDSGVVEGRAAFFDLLIEARWGALLSGDKIQVDTASRCSCGRPGPTVLDTIERYREVDDDKLSCAGSVNSYIRGVLASD